MHKQHASVFLALALFIATVSLVKAERLESDSFVIQFGNFNMTAGEKSSDNYNLTDTVGQTAAGPFGQYGSSTYFVGSGFQYIYQIDAFSFRLSKTAINLGTLSPGTHNTDSHTMTINTKGAGGYVVYAFETRPLSHTTSAAVIPNTTCDTANCDYTVAGIWQDGDVPGFGFNLTGDDIPADFLTGDHFRAFADRSNNEPMQVVMSSSNVAKTREATVTYQAGISETQAAGQYETGISFVAVPGF